MRGLARNVGPATENRAIVMTPGYGPGSFNIYFHGATPLPPSGVEVRELVVAALPSSGLGGTPPPARALDVPAGFHLGQRVETSTYTLLRYRSVVPQLVTPVRLTSLGLDRSEGEGTWLQSGVTRR
jgi:hypothetical protein